MTGLKTLKDLHFWIVNHGKDIGKKVILLDDAKKEAIKHIKQAQDNAMVARKKGDEGLVNFHIGEKCSMEEFFNIKKEEEK